MVEFNINDISRDLKFLAHQESNPTTYDLWIENNRLLESEWKEIYRGQWFVFYKQREFILENSCFSGNTLYKVKDSYERNH